MIFEDRIINELKSVLDTVKDYQLENAVKVIADSPSIYVYGCGRSGYMMRAFAMRLMHLGRNAYFIGDTETPAAKEGDLLIIGSGSGETGSLKAIASKAKFLKMRLLVITGNENSSLGKIADDLLVIKTDSSKKDEMGEIVVDKDQKSESVFPMGSVFEISMLIISDILINMLMMKLQVKSNFMVSRHANLE